MNKKCLSCRFVVFTNDSPINIEVQVLWEDMFSFLRNKFPGVMLHVKCFLKKLLNSFPARLIFTFQPAIDEWYVSPHPCQHLTLFLNFSYSSRWAVEIISLTLFFGCLPSAFRPAAHSSLCDSHLGKLIENQFQVLTPLAPVRDSKHAALCWQVWTLTQATPWPWKTTTQANLFYVL